MTYPRGQAVIIPQIASNIYYRPDTDIWAGSAALVQAQIDAAREDGQIKAVVVYIDSPGGEVVATQSIFLELEALRHEVPVVGSIETIAASGGYYAVVTLQQLWPVQVDGHEETLVWRVDLVSSAALADLRGTERLGSGAAMMRDIQKDIRAFVRDAGSAR